MILSRNWLNEFVDLKDITDKEFNDEMTLSGSKVETIERPDENLKNVVVGKILEMKRHENSDHMWVCKIDVGGERELQIVTGAQNVNIGDLVPVALDGSTLPGGKEIRTGKLRGELSEGMLCSLGELGLEQRDFPYAIEDGIFILEEDCLPGDDIREVCGLNDSVVEFEITNNRPDCYSLLGLISFLTAGPKEVRAWTIVKGTKAPQAAGKIHTDFEKGFIRAEVVNFNTLVEHGTMAACKEKGLIRSEGKDYVMQDGDIVVFRFNV